MACSTVVKIPKTQVTKIMAVEVFLCVNAGISLSFFMLIWVVVLKVNQLTALTMMAIMNLGIVDGQPGKNRPTIKEIDLASVGFVQSIKIYHILFLVIIRINLLGNID